MRGKKRGSEPPATARDAEAHGNDGHDQHHSNSTQSAFEVVGQNLADLFRPFFSSVAAAMAPPVAHAGEVRDEKRDADECGRNEKASEEQCGTRRPRAKQAGKAKATQPRKRQAPRKKEAKVKVKAPKEALREETQQPVRKKLRTRREQPANEGNGTAGEDDGRLRLPCDREAWSDKEVGLLVKAIASLKSKPPPTVSEVKDKYAVLASQQAQRLRTCKAIHRKLQAMDLAFSPPDATEEYEYEDDGKPVKDEGFKDARKFPWTEEEREEALKFIDSNDLIKDYEYFVVAIEEATGERCSRKSTAFQRFVMRCREEQRLGKDTRTAEA